MAKSSRRALTEAVVDLSTRSDATVGGNQLPMIRELQAYLQSLDSVVLVYHRKRDKKLTNFDHIYVVFETAVDADEFLRTWLLWDESHFLKIGYVLQRTPHFLSGDITLLEHEIGCIRWVVTFESSKEPIRFKGPAFVASSFGSGPAAFLGSLEETHDNSNEAAMDQMFRHVDLEHTLEVLELERDEMADENAELRAQINRFKMLSSHSNGGAQGSGSP